MKQNFLDIFSKDPQISSLITIQAVGAELFNVDRRTDEQTEMTKQITTFRNSSNSL